MARNEMTMEEFARHEGSSSGSSSILKWKENGQVDLLLHTEAPIYSLWSHSWYALGKDKETDEERLFFVRFNSYEDERRSLRNMRYRLDGKKPEHAHQYPWHTEPVRYHGVREFPPEVCPFAFLLEWVREQIETGKIGWTDKIFDIDVEGGDENATVIHAGGFCNLFRGDMTKEEKVQLKKAGVRLDEAYQESGFPRLQYVFVVVPYDKPEGGPVIAIESETIGKKMQKHINDRRDDLGADEGDPRKNPVVFRWEYDESKSFSAKYDVKVRTKTELTDEHRAAIQGEYPRDRLDRLTEDSNLVQLRQGFERWWCHKVVPPWDAIFSVAMERYKGQPVTQDPADFDPDQLEGDDEGDEEADTGGLPSQADAPDAEDDDEVECDHCHQAMPGDATTCPHCGATYDAAGNMTPPPPKEPEKPKTRKSRSAAAAGEAPRSKS